MNASVSLPQFQCHKRVRAGRITQLREAGGSVDLALDCGNVGGVVNVDAAWIAKHKPQPGGYYVVYEDGYASYSPAKAFEDGYTRVDDGIVTQGQVQRWPAEMADRGTPARMLPGDVA